MTSSSYSDNGSLPNLEGERSLTAVFNRLTNTLARDALIQQTIHALREQLQVDRVLLYYLYPGCKGQVTFEALSDPQLSIYGSTGPDECFNGEYAALYLAGRVRAIADIETEPIADCHREFLRDLNVRANLVVPVLSDRGLWGLLIAHHCQAPHQWQAADIDTMRQSAATLATSPLIQSS